MTKVPYQYGIRSIMYAMVATRPNIAFAVGVGLVSQFMSNPGKVQWDTQIRIMVDVLIVGNLLQGTLFHCLGISSSRMCRIVNYRGRVCCSQ